MNYFSSVVNAKDMSNGQSALHLAVVNNHVVVVGALLSTKFPASCVASNRLALLHYFISFISYLIRLYFSIAGVLAKIVFCAVSGLIVSV